MSECRAKESNKRILVLANNDVGLYKFRKEILQAFIQDGYTVFISLPNGDYIDSLVALGCHFIDTSFNRRGMNPFADLSLFCRYWKILRDVDPCMVLTYTIKPNVYGGLVCRLKRHPYLVNVTGLGTSIENPSMLQKIVLMLYRLGVNGSQGTFFQNKANMDFMLHKGVCGKQALLLPGSGVDLTAHRYREYPEDDGTIRFLSIMRVMRDKGIYELLECAENICARFPKVSFTLVGDYDDDSYREPVEKAQEKGIIQYLGFRNDIDDLMGSHHCIINPSYHEGMSNVLLEAAACGRPVIASNVPGCMETFDEGVTGLGFGVKNTEDLVRAVEQFINIPYEQKKAMGEKGRLKIEQEFDRKKVISMYMEQIKKYGKKDYIYGTL